MLSRSVLRGRSLFALHDVILLGYLFVVRMLLATVRTGSMSLELAGAAERCAARLDVALALLVMACVVRRGPWGELLPGTDTNGWARISRNLYRAALAWGVIQSYVMLRDLLPVLRPDSVDSSLLSIDYAVLGFEPALYLERFNTPGAVEWFSFFYFSYFFICAAYLGSIVWVLRPDRYTTEFAIGSLLVVCIGQLGYIAVPGYGPVRHLADQFAGPLEGGFFWGCVCSAVEAGGAMKDIFPSLHTALPCWFTLHAIRRATLNKRWRLPAALTAFFATNIVISTMFLRWHYAVDVAAGLLLALLAAYAAPRLARHDERWRRERGLSAPFSADAEVR